MFQIEAIDHVALIVQDKDSTAHFLLNEMVNETS